MILPLCLPSINPSNQPLSPQILPCLHTDGHGTNISLLVLASIIITHTLFFPFPMWLPVILGHHLGPS